VLGPAWAPAARLQCQAASQGAAQSQRNPPPCSVFISTPQVEGDALAGLTLLLDLPPVQRREAEVLARRLGAEVGPRTLLASVLKESQNTNYRFRI
jgi:hypothetical protein